MMTTSDASRRGRNNRRKGGAFEREIAHRLCEVFHGLQVVRNLQPQGGRSAGSDLRAEGHLLPLAVECKHGIRPNLRAALVQAESDRLEGQWPVAICRDNGGEEWAVMRPEDLFELLGGWWQEVK